MEQGSHMGHCRRARKEVLYFIWSRDCTWVTVEGHAERAHVSYERTIASESLPRGMRRDFILRMEEETHLGQL